MTDHDAEILLATIRDSMKLKITADRDGDAWLIVATDGQEHWRARGEDLYRTAVQLARLVGFDVTDG